MSQTVTFQRIEAVSIFFASLYIYWYLDFSLIVFIILLFVFDIFMIGYLINPKIGALIYNLGHSMIFPPILSVIGYVNNANMLIAFSLIWFAHIGIDRGLGYGLKFTSGFKDTHLGQIGKEKGKIILKM